MLYKYLVSERNSFFNDRKIRFSQLEVLNDPFESNILLQIKDDSVLIEKKYTHMEQLFPNSKSVAKMKEIELDLNSPSGNGKLAAQFFSTKIGLLSLSKDYDNLLMWAHYAESHKGFVVGFDEHHDFFGNSGDPSIAPSMVPVDYSGERSCFSEVDLPHVFCKKSPHWCYEREVRIFKSFHLAEDSARQDPMGFRVNLFEIPSDAIKAIYFGANYKPDILADDIIKIRKNIGDIDIYKAIVSKVKFDIEFLPI